MSVTTIRTAISITSNALGNQESQRGLSGVTVAVMLTALAVVTLTIAQAVISGGGTTAQAGIPGLIG